MSPSALQELLDSGPNRREDHLSRLDSDALRAALREAMDLIDEFRAKVYAQESDDRKLREGLAKPPSQDTPKPGDPM